MISQIVVTGVNLDLGDGIKKYINKKIGRLDRYLPRNSRAELRAEVRMRQTNDKMGNKYECEVAIQASGAQHHAKEATLNMFAAVDIVEAKLKNQIIKHKDEQLAKRREQFPGLFGRLRARLSK